MSTTFEKLQDDFIGQKVDVVMYRGTRPGCWGTGHVPTVSYDIPDNEPVVNKLIFLLTMLGFEEDGISIRVPDFGTPRAGEVVIGVSKAEGSRVWRISRLQLG